MSVKFPAYLRVGLSTEFYGMLTRTIFLKLKEEPFLSYAYFFIQKVQRVIIETYFFCCDVLL